MDLFKPDSHHNIDLSLDVICMILDHLLPRKGLCISNDSDLNTELTTISALSRTNRMIRNRVVQHIFSRPLHITITNGNECRPRSELNPRLAKALSLPFYKFPEIKVIFAPDLNIEPCSRGSHRKIPWPETPNDEQHMRLRHHWICIDEQCENLGVRFRDAIGRLPIDTSSPHFTFSWDGSRGIDEANKTRKSPLWEFVSLSGTMMPWEWVDEYQWPLHSKRPAMTYDICLPDQVATEILSDAPSWEETMGRLTPQPTLHEPRNAEELGEHTWPFHWADFWWHRSCDSAWFMCYHKIPGFNGRYIVTLKKVEKLGDADSGYVYTARRENSA